MSENKYVIDIRHSQIEVDGANLSIDCKDIKIGYGQFVVVQGNNGSGKSTFLKFLSAIPPYYYHLSTESDMTILDKQYKDYTDGELARNVVYIGQSEDFIYGYSIYQTLISSTITAINNDRKYSSIKKELKRKAREVAFEYYRKYLYHFVHQKGNNDKHYFESHPDRDGKFMYFKRPTSLSGGQQKMIHILQGIIKQRVLGINLILLDEPFNNLDKENKKIIIDIINEVRNENPQVTFIVITHCHLFPCVTSVLTLDLNENGVSIPEYALVSKWKQYDCLKN